MSGDQNSEPNGNPAEQVKSNVNTRLESLDALEQNMWMSTLSRLPVIVILGATGTGKSKLAISLAKKFNGEIISADSMQIYKGLDVLTNKVTEEEMCGVPHHMIGITNPSENFDVVRYQAGATKIVQRILIDGKIPFIVGGTNYYIESLLWKILMQVSVPEKVVNLPTKRRLSTNDADNKPPNKPSEDQLFHDNAILKYLSQIHGNFMKEDELVAKWTSQELYSALKIIDPDRAQKFHPNDRRKVLRSLQVRFQTGIKHSELIEQQRKDAVNDSDKELPPENTSSHLGGPLRYPNSFCLWIQAPKPILEERINARVDEMVAKGLQSEISNYIDHLREMQSGQLDFTKGLLQSIGFKEFQEYLKLLPPERDTDEEGQKKFYSGLDLLKIATRQYAKKQVRWIKQRFLRPSRRQIPPVYWLDGSDAHTDVWDRNVTKVAETIVEAHLLNQVELVPLMKERLVPQITTEEDDLVIRECPVCIGRVFVGRIQYELHLKSGRHKRMTSKNKSLIKKTDDEGLHNSHTA